jgi:hypothetical protein
MNKKIDKPLNFIECNSILKRLGEELKFPTTIMAVGGYCMLCMGVRSSTVDIDFIPSKREFVVPEEFHGVVNSDVLNIADLRLKFSELVEFADKRITFGNLVVVLADVDLLLAMKVLAIRARTRERDRVDLLSLYKKANLERSYKAYSKISLFAETYEDWILDLETDIFLAENSVKEMNLFK